MEIKISGLKCDHCDYRDDSVKFSEYPEYIGHPCPKCGNNLLTTEEYNTCLRLYNTTEVLNKVGNVLKWFNPMHYYRLLFGDNRSTMKLTKEFAKRKQ